MPPTKIPVARADAHRAAVLRLLDARRGGTTRVELMDILDLNVSAVKNALATLTASGAIRKHGDPRRHVARYTLPDDPLTRPLPSRSPNAGKHEARDTRASLILAELERATLPLTKAGLGRRLGEAPGLLDRALRELHRDGIVAKIGSGQSTRYALERTIKITAPAVCAA